MPLRRQRSGEAACRARREPQTDFDRNSDYRARTRRLDGPNNTEHQRTSPQTQRAPSAQAVNRKVVGSTPSSGAISELEIGPREDLQDLDLLADLRAKSLPDRCCPLTPGGLM